MGKPTKVGFPCFSEGDMVNEQFLRTEMILGEEAMETLRRSHVAVFGLGGVGSYAVEALVRSGVGELTLVDEDSVAVSNLNRQLEALHSTIGRSKAEAIAARCRDINPDAVLHPIVGRYEADSREQFFAAHYDYIVDAIDLVSCKLDLIETAIARAIPIISALGTGNKLNAQALRIADISETHGCPLARVMRKELRARCIEHTKVLFSPESAAPTEQKETPPPGRRSVPASLVWVPGCAGLMMGGEVVLDLVGRTKE